MAQILRKLLNRRSQNNNPPVVEVHDRGETNTSHSSSSDGFSSDDFSNFITGSSSSSSGGSITSLSASASSTSLSSTFSASSSSSSSSLPTIHRGHYPQSSFDSLMVARSHYQQQQNNINNSHNNNIILNSNGSKKKQEEGNSSPRMMTTSMSMTPISRSNSSGHGNSFFNRLASEISTSTTRRHHASEKANIFDLTGDWLREMTGGGGGGGGGGSRVSSSKHSQLLALQAKIISQDQQQQQQQQARKSIARSRSVSDGSNIILDETMNSPTSSVIGRLGSFLSSELSPPTASNSPFKFPYDSNSPISSDPLSSFTNSKEKNLLRAIHTLPVTVDDSFVLEDDGHGEDGDEDDDDGDEAANEGVGVSGDGVGAEQYNAGEENEKHQKRHSSSHKSSSTVNNNNNNSREKRKSRQHVQEEYDDEEMIGVETEIEEVNTEENETDESDGSDENVTREITLDGNSAYDTSILFSDDYEGIFQCQTMADKLFYACALSADRGLTTLGQLLQMTDRGVSDVSIFRDKNRNNISLLHAAARANNAACIEFLIKDHRANIDSVDSILATPLHYACSANSKAAVMTLLAHGANVNARDRYDNFPLLIAMKNNHVQVMKTLILFNADIHLKTKGGDTCLHIASREGYTKRVRFMLGELKMSPSRLNTNNENVLFTGLAHRSITQIICDKVEGYKLLCRMVTVTNCSGSTVFHKAAEHGYLESFLVIIQALKLKEGGESDKNKTLEEFIYQRLNEYDIAKGFTPLQFAVAGNHISTVKYLASCAQVDIDKKDARNGNTALHLAIEAGNQTICDILIQIGKADTTIKNKRESCSKMATRVGIKLENPTKRFSLQTLKKSTSVLFRSGNNLS